MAGVMCALAGAGGNIYQLTVGSEVVDLGKGGSIAYYGYLAGNFGNLTPTVWDGFTINGIYSDGSSTTFTVSGDAHLLSPVLRVNGANQNLGSGSYSSGSTTFSGSATNPFTPDGAVLPVSIS